VAFHDLATERTVRLSSSRTVGLLSAPLDDPDGGWAELMELAATFPLEMLSFGGSRANVDSLPVVLPKPRAVSHDESVGGVDYDYVVDLVDGFGLSLATW
jgi:hypothetical protein